MQPEEGRQHLNTTARCELANHELASHEGGPASGGQKLNHRSPTAIAFILTLANLALGQTFDVNKGTASTAAKEQKQSQAGSGATQNLGWGSSIEVARQARAAQDALKKGDYGAAVAFAEQAANAAPQNADLWFLLGYSARLADRYPLSVDAYKHGLQDRPNSTAGLAGLAETYAKMGRGEEARQLLMKVAEGNPKDANALQLAGELSLNSDPQMALDLLRRAAAVQSSPRTDLLLARAYQRLGRPEESRQSLARAQSRAPRDPEILRAIAGEYRESGR